MSRTKTLLIVSFLLTVSACSAFEPFVDRRREAGERDMTKLYVGKSKPEAPAICYNGWYSDPEEVQKVADDECKKQGTGTKAVLNDSSFFTCRVLIPSHAYFKCVKSK